MVEKNPKGCSPDAFQWSRSLSCFQSAFWGKALPAMIKKLFTIECFQSSRSIFCLVSAFVFFTVGFIRPKSPPQD
jgi:hypothetical protein